MKKIIAGAILSIAFAAQAATAFWTGRMEYVTTVTYQQGIRCEYNIYGNTFWKVFVNKGVCPMSIEVE